jgi:hypothetical protein
LTTSGQHSLYTDTIWHIEPIATKRKGEPRGLKTAATPELSNCDLIADSKQGAVMVRQSGIAIRRGP